MLLTLLYPFAHPVACCCMLLGVVTQSLKPVELLSLQLPTFVLFCDCQSIPQQCWIRLHSSSNIALHVAYKVLWVVSFPWCTRVPTLLGVVASVSPPLPTRMRLLLTLLEKFMSDFFDSRTTALLVTKETKIELTLGYCLLLFAIFIT